MNIFDVKDKYILITGASSGLGHHIAELFAKRCQYRYLCQTVRAIERIRIAYKMNMAYKFIPLH